MRFYKRLLRCCYLLIALWAATVTIGSKYFANVSMCFSPTKDTAAPRFITIHHDGISRPITLDEINRYHRDSCGWASGLAYHYFVDSDKIYKIRDERQRGTHVLNNNTANIGICIHGNFNESCPTLKQQILIIILINKLCFEFDISKQNIKRHQDWEQNPTSCCGKNFDLDGLKKYILK